MPCVLQTKKRYVGYAFESQDQTDPIFDAKGIETVRRDGTPATAKILEKTLKILFDTRDVSQACSNFFGSLILLFIQLTTPCPSHLLRCYDQNREYFRSFLDYPMLIVRKHSIAMVLSFSICQVAKEGNSCVFALVSVMTCNTDLNLSKLRLLLTCD